MFEDRTAKGAALLTEKIPGWENALNIAILNMACPQKCVLGQQFGAYINGVYALNLTAKECVEHGFTLDRCEPDRFYIDLTDAWREAIREKLMGDILLLI